MAQVQTRQQVDSQGVGAPTKKDVKREKSAGAKLMEDQKRKDARRSLIIKSSLVAAVLLAVVGTITVVAMTKSKATDVLPGTQYPILGREHVAEGTKVDYNSNPPSSGNHYATPANWGIYTSQLPDEQLVHNLEHGGIWISYKDPNDKELAAKLTALAKRFQSKIVLEPRPENTTAIAMASWGWVQTLDTYDEQKIVDFYNAHKNKGPEFVPDMGI